MFFIFTAFFLFGLRLLCLWRCYKVTSLVYWGFLLCYDSAAIFALCLLKAVILDFCHDLFFLLLSKTAFPFLPTLSDISLENIKCCLQLVLIFIRKNDAVFKLHIWKYVSYEVQNLYTWEIYNFFLFVISFLYLFYSCNILKELMFIISWLLKALLLLFFITQNSVNFHLVIYHSLSHIFCWLIGRRNIFSFKFGLQLINLISIICNWCQDEEKHILKVLLRFVKGAMLWSGSLQVIGICVKYQLNRNSRYSLVYWNVQNFINH